MDYECRDIGLRITKLGRSLGINVTPHVLRHSRVVQPIEAGVPIERVADIAGHRRLDTTLATYGRVRAEDLSKHLQQAKW